MSVDASAAAEASAQAAAQTVEVVQAIENAAEAAIEHAENRVEAAEAVAEQIADAALMTNLGQRVDDTNRRIDEWSGKQLSLEAEIANLKTQGTEILAKIADLSAQLSSQDSPSLLIQSPSPDQTGTEMIVEEAAQAAETISPDQVILPSGAEESPVAQIRKRRRVFI